MSGVEATVQGHYGRRPEMLERIEAALKAAGKDPQKLVSADLHPFDQLHGRGIAATTDLVRHAALTPGMRVLDLGCGIGGASRYLAEMCGSIVTGLDLTPEFVEIARVLTARCGLGERIEFRQGSALDLPFAAASFDRVWCHNVTMNIGDKAKLASEVARVLQRGGRFVCAETEQGPGGALIFPLPWASDASSSFLVTPEEMRRALEGAGLGVLEQLDMTPASLAYRQEVQARAARGEPPLQMNEIVMGEDFLTRGRNMAKCAGERRILEQIIVAEKK
jgi:SAM-dependent methyltransferase